MRVLITETLDRSGLRVLQEHAEVDVRKGLSPEALREIMCEYDGLVVRSATDVNAELLAAGAGRLRVVGRAGTGVDNIDVDAATRLGITVVNAPTANSNAVAEQTLALMLALARRVHPAITSLKAGRWEKGALQGTEVKGKTLGLVGLGRIARLVASKVRGLEMQVIAFDPYVGPEGAASSGVRLVELDDLLRQADYISVHTPLTSATQGLIGARELGLMKPGAYLVNCARGGIIDEDALAEALKEGRIGGAALDVFEVEPATDNPLVGLGNVIATPHLAGSTAEAQEGVAVDVARAVVDVLAGRIPESPVNVPYLAPEAAARLRPYVDLAERLGSFFVQWRGTLANRLELTYAGDLVEYDTRILTAAFLAGLLRPVCADPVNIVNASHVAAERGLTVSEVRRGCMEPFDSMIVAAFPDAEGETNASGTVIHGEPHLVGLDGQRLDCVAQGHMVADLHHDRPGIVGSMGRILGEEDINISFVQMSRASKGGASIMILGLDESVPPAMMPRFLEVPGVQRVRSVVLPPFDGYVNGNH
ncbi:MAG: phosphoglycerate dehydrogenase [Chloroflexi bacterium]|nr:phosphoglycerate dehydrogenase [Chloroflexota bacterium]